MAYCKAIHPADGGVADPVSQRAAETPRQHAADLQRFMNDQRNGDLVGLGAHSDNPAQRLFFRDRFYARRLTQRRLASPPRSRACSIPGRFFT
jgi:hypothetical protein